MLAPGIVESRVIPNGVDLGVFRPGDRQMAREALGLPVLGRMVLFSANTIRANPWKDFDTLRRAVGAAAERLPDESIHFVALGDMAPPERFGSATITTVPFQADVRLVAKYYQAADLYIHAAKADTFPTSVIESLACGTPVVATAVGGIPEQVNPVDLPGMSHAGDAIPVRDLANGALVPLGDSDAMSHAIARFLSDEPLRSRLSENAVADARGRFDLQVQVERYLEWYEAVLDRTRRRHER